MAVHDAPLSVLAPVHMGGAQGVGPRLAVKFHAIVLVADGVGQVAAGARRNNLEVVFGLSRRTRTQPHGTSRSSSAQPVPEPFAPNSCHRVGPGPEGEPRFYVAVMDCWFGRYLFRQHLGQEIVDSNSDDNLQYS